MASNLPPTSRRFRPPVPPRSPDANQSSPRSTVPQNQVFSPGTDGFENPGDEHSFQEQSMDTQPMGSKVGTVKKQPSPAGTRPMNVSARTPLPKAPGIVRKQTHDARRAKAPGLKQNLGTLPNARPAAKGLNQTVTPARSTPRAPGIAPTISMQKTRNMRGPGANPAFYGDFGL
jgi:hypothetical protein